MPLEITPGELSGNKAPVFKPTGPTVPIANGSASTLTATAPQIFRCYADGDITVTLTGVPGGSAVIKMADKTVDWLERAPGQQFSVAA